MKRTLLRQGAIVAACAAVFVFAACSDAPEFDARTDTVYSLETPSVTAKAYPGVNFVSWKPVTGANGYKVTVYEEGSFKKEVAEKELNGYYYSDTNLTNGKTYTYSIEAISATNPGTTRAVYATNSRGEASVRAIVPPAGTRPLDLPAYEDGYDGKNPKEVKNKEWVVTAENLKVKAENGKVYITFPMKAYLKYEIVAYKGEDKSSHEAVNDILVDTNKASASDQNANDVLAQKSLAPSPSGKYQ
ncbi:MAG: fibronectin type III domain-containing protein, partial [Treponemataceae bacterium]|nr:fibronectin type III domain-containing protein [Treponemataceae bacterium]